LTTSADVYFGVATDAIDEVAARLGLRKVVEGGLAIVILQSTVGIVVVVVSRDAVG
jgi:hypothetical protein